MSLNRLSQNWLTEQAEIRPDATAVVMADRKLSYGELEVKSNQLAWLLKDRNCRKGDRICFLMPKTLEAFIAIFGILKADCIYVPLDPEGPVARSAKMVKKAGASWILAAGPVEKKLSELMSVPFVAGMRPKISAGWMDFKNPSVSLSFTPEFFSQELLESFANDPPNYKNRSQDPAHILFTSGSTGEPKGVVNTHENDIQFIKWAVNYFGINSTDRISCHPPLHFDMSSLDIYSTVSTGAELHPVPPEINIFPKFIAEFIRKRGLTQWFSVPSVLSLMANMNVVKVGDFPEMKRLLWCGEVMPTASLIYLMKRLPHVKFTNLYGPTETTIASSYYTVPSCPDDETAEIPIGKACDGEHLHVLDDDMMPVKPGEIGQLYISGKGVGDGYWEDPEKTGEVFLLNPFTSSGDSDSDSHRIIYKTGDLAEIREDGLVYFHGREDHQVKSRGYRIELGEIENALHGLRLTLECAVVALPSEQFGSVIIGCAYVPAAGKQTDATLLKKELGKLLPGYMVPVMWKEFEELPKNKNGKIDRGSIRERFQKHETEVLKYSR